MLTRRTLGVLGLGTLAAGATRAETPVKVALGYTAVADYAAAFLGVDGGIFARHGVDVSLVAISVNSMEAPGLVGGSLQAALPTPSVLLQAADSGLDLVALANITNTSRAGSYRGVLARPAAHIQGAKDFVGRRVGVPGIGALLDLLFRRWLIEEKVAPGQVTFVEVGFPQQMDALRSASVDAVIAVDPFATRIAQSGVGMRVVDLLDVTPEGETVGVLACTRAWADGNKAAARALQAGWAEASKAASDTANVAATRAAIGHWTHLPEAALATLALPFALDPVITPKQWEWWIGVMKQQGLLQGSLDPNRLVWGG
jgi:NitT/TauT family transport system substrate-binding protein